MFGSSYLGEGLLEGIREYLCIALAVGCTIGEPLEPADPVAEPPAEEQPAPQSPSPQQPAPKSDPAPSAPPKTAPKPAPAPNSNPAPQPAAQPVAVQLTVSPALVPEGEVAKLSWQSSNASSCMASGNWGGSRAVSGSESTPPLSEAATYRLSCSSVTGQGATQSVSVQVRALRPISVAFRAEPEVIKSGESATLYWRADNADSCEAVGDWQGERASKGQFDTGPIREDASFTLRCRNQDFEEVSLVSVDVERFALKWQAPSKNIDGSAASDIAGYRVYWGAQPEQYVGSVTLHGAFVTEWTPELPPGVYYFAISAFDEHGNESEKSAPARQVIP